MNQHVTVMCSSNIADHFNVLKFIKIQNQLRWSIPHVMLMLVVASSSSSRFSTGDGEFKGDRGWHVLLNKPAY